MRNVGWPPRDVEWACREPGSNGVTQLPASSRYSAAISIDGAEDQHLCHAGHRDFLLLARSEDEAPGVTDG